jgi:CMP-N-acetylneuraminic acid synthetase
MRYWVVIPARGGSKRIHNKNVATVAGHSLLEWALQASQDFPTIISTERSAHRVLDEAARLGGSPYIFFRPERLAEDWTPDLPVAQNVLTQLPYLSGEDFLIWLRPTSPFRSRQDVSAVVQTMQDNPEIDSIRSVVKAEHPPSKMYTVHTTEDDKRRLCPLTRWHFPNHPSSIVPPAFLACGWIDAVRVRAIKGGDMEGDYIAPLAVDRTRGLDINTPEDLERANEIAARLGWTPGRC